MIFFVIVVLVVTPAFVVVVVFLSEFFCCCCSCSYSGIYVSSIKSHEKKLHNIDTQNLKNNKFFFKSWTTVKDGIFRRKRRKK